MEDIKDFNETAEFISKYCKDYKLLPETSTIYFKFEIDIKNIFIMINELEEFGNFSKQFKEEDKNLMFLTEEELNSNLNYEEISKNKMKYFCVEAKEIIKKYLTEEDISNEQQIMYSPIKSKIIQDMSSQEVYDTILANGFKECYKQENDIEKEIIFYREDGLIAHTLFNRCNGIMEFNKGTIWGELKEITNTEFFINPDGTHVKEGSTNYFALSIMGHVFDLLNDIKSCGKLFPVFEEEDKYLYMLTLSEIAVNSDWKEVSRDKMSQFPEEAKRIVQKYLDNPKTNNKINKLKSLIFGKKN